MTTISSQFDVADHIMSEVLILVIHIYCQVSTSASIKYIFIGMIRPQEINQTEFKSYKNNQNMLNVT